jgi:xanthine dehydrogenase YagR molybdenum-binding subunit
MNFPIVGPAVSRVDGRKKVTGTATYSAEWARPRLAYAYMVLSTIARGRVIAIDRSDALRQDGVITILVPQNAPKVDGTSQNPNDRYLTVLQDDLVRHDRQPVALVIADTFEHAKYAASLVRVEYAAETPRTRFSHGEHYKPKDIKGEPPDTTRGDADAAFAAAPVRVDNVYTTPIEHHNPMEPHATIAEWDGERLTIYDANQGVWVARDRIARVFGIPPANVRVITKFLGGAFGSKGSMWSHTVLAAMAAKAIGRPVQLSVWRPQMFGSVGYRPGTSQRVALGADRDGKLATQIHEVVSQTSTFDEFVEPSGAITTMLYASPALRVTHLLTRLDYATPTYMRAPGESSGSFALESAMDELAYATKLDPLELRLRNYADMDPTKNLPFSSKSLRECYRVGAEAIGWSERISQIGSMRDGPDVIGMGMATAAYPTNRSKASATATLNRDGTASVRSGGVDVGTGAYTTFTMIAAETLGLPLERVDFDLGDTVYPEAPVAGGSQLTASVGSAVKLASLDALAKLKTLAAADARSPLYGIDVAALDVANGRLVHGASSRSEAFEAILARSGGQVRGSWEAAPGVEKNEYSMHAFGAQFAIVRVDLDLGTVRLVKQIGAFAAGRIVNAKTARSQYLGGMVMGIGMALLEETRPDARTGRFMNANLSEYLVPVHADVGAMDALIVPEDDSHVNEIGVKGIGEIGIVGAAAAIANAVYHATGTRIRHLPITPAKVLGLAEAAPELQS